MRSVIERRRHTGDRGKWHRYLRKEARPLLNHMRDLGDTIQTQALKGIPIEDQHRLFESLALMNSNLIQGCCKATADKETYHYG